MDWYPFVAFVLIGLGVLALAGEFVVPTGGGLVVAAVALFAVGVGLILLYGSGTEAAVAVVGLAVGIPAMMYVVMRGYKQLALKSALTAPELAGPATPAADLGSDLGSLRGRTGKAASPLRPAGVAVFDGRRVDALSEGAMIDAGTWVRCVGVRGAAVVVRPAEASDPLADIKLDEFG